MKVQVRIRNGIWEIMDALQLFRTGMSFQTMLDKRLLPPLPILNHFLDTLIDDLDMTQDGIIEWKPFKLSNDDYRDICNRLKDEGYEFQIDSNSDAKTYQEWFEGIM